MIFCWSNMAKLWCAAAGAATARAPSAPSRIARFGALIRIRDSFELGLPAFLGLFAAEFGAGQVLVVLQDALGLVDVGIVFPEEVLGGRPFAFPHRGIGHYVLDTHRLAAVQQVDALDHVELVVDWNA